MWLGSGGTPSPPVPGLRAAGQGGRPGDVLVAEGGGGGAGPVAVAHVQGEAVGGEPAGGGGAAGGDGDAGPRGVAGVVLDGALPPVDPVQAAEHRREHRRRHAVVPRVEPDGPAGLGVKGEELQRGHGDGAARPVRLAPRRGGRDEEAVHDVAVHEVGRDGVDVPLAVVYRAAQLVRQDAVLHDVVVAAPSLLARMRWGTGDRRAAHVALQGILKPSGFLCICNRV